jgi:murein L,D-transpeptidase YcbB/YkuD
MKYIFIIWLFSSSVLNTYAQSKMLWLPEQCKANRYILLQYLEQCDSLGLDKNAYNFDLLQSLNEKPLTEDSVNTDKSITLSAMQFFHDVAYGNTIPHLEFNGINEVPAYIDIPGKFYRALEENTFNELLKEIEPDSPEYINIKKKIIQYLLKLSDTTLHPGIIVSYLVDSTNHPLIEKLYQLGYLDSLDYHLPEKVMRAQLRKAQHMFEFYEDGGLRPDVINALNAPLTERIKELQSSLNVFRWLNCYRQSKKMVVVNIPSANLFMYAGDSTLLSSRMVVGKPATPTPTLSSKITELVMFPYWNVPYKIATRELLPAIRNNIPYLEAGNYQVLDKSGNILDPYKINWKTLSTKNFPYTIRQVNGCDNSLGIMKLNFYNPYDVYLHDTPWKNFFAYNKRYFSHGCMRVEEAISLAKAVLPERTDEINKLAATCIAPSGKPLTMHPNESVPVFVLYQIAWPDKEGTIRFFEDAYNKIK